MKLTYKIQLILSVAIILLANVLTELFSHWLYRSLGFVLCGLIWIVHPVLPNGAENSRKTRFLMQGAGVVLILIGVFTRVHF